MARIRTVKPEFFTDEKLSECSVMARLLFIGLWVHADDEGRMRYSPKRIKMQVFPGDNLDAAPLIEELVAQGLVEIYRVDGSSFLCVKNFRRHQKINRPTPSTLPPPPLTDSSMSAHVRKGKEGNGKEGNLGGMETPSPHESLTECSLSPHDVPDETSHDATTPADLHQLQYAAKLLEEIGVPATFANKTIVAEAITAIVKQDRKSNAAAFEFLLAKAKDAQDNGIDLNKFWFEDAKWKSNGKANGKPSIGQIVERERAILHSRRAL